MGGYLWPVATHSTLAEAVGFEPTVAFTTLVFKTRSFGRSDMLPLLSVYHPLVFYLRFLLAQG